jgi:hypothetical protein
VATRSGAPHRGRSQRTDAPGAGNSCKPDLDEPGSRQSERSCGALDITFVCRIAKRGRHRALAEDAGVNVAENIRRHCAERSSSRVFGVDDVGAASQRR